MGFMAHCSTLIDQLLQLIPRHVFDLLVYSHAWQGPNPRKSTYWSHLGAIDIFPWIYAIPRMCLVDYITELPLFFL